MLACAIPVGVSWFSSIRFPTARAVGRRSDVPPGLLATEI